MPGHMPAHIRATAAAAPDWAALSRLVRGCTACPELAASRTSVVVGQAPAGARLLLLGEAPGAEEDARAEPFVGRAGQLLDRTLGEAGLSRRNVAVLNILKCRPPGNRRPSPAEVACCREWLDRQLELLVPALVVTLGTTAAAALLGRVPSLAAVRGRVHQVPHAAGRPGPLSVLPTYHPSAALRFGPAGEPLRALRADLELAASLAAVPTA
jgi:uracil-DNA glycosylase family 4